MLRKDLMLRNDMGEWESRRFVLTKCYMSHWKEGEEVRFLPLSLGTEIAGAVN